MLKKIILGLISLALVVVLGGASAFAFPVVVDSYNSIGFENAEMFINNDQSTARVQIGVDPSGNPIFATLPTVTVGDTFWGVLDANFAKAPSDPSGNIGPSIWPQAGTVPPLELTGYFAVDVVTAIPGGGPGGADYIGFGPAAVDPNGILAAGVSLQFFEDNADNYNNSTAALGLATSTDGNPYWSFSFGPSPDGDSPGGYWYTNAPIIIPPFGPGLSVGDAWIGLNIVGSPGGLSFIAIDDPQETYLLAFPPPTGVAVVPNPAWPVAQSQLLVDFVGNSESFYVADVNQNTFFHFASNDPVVYFPTPEPASMLLLGSGLLGLAGIGRRRFRKKD